MSSMFSSLFARDPIRDFPFELDEKLHSDPDHSIWTLHSAHKKSGEVSRVVVLASDFRSLSAPEIEAAKATAKRLKTLRHPNILTYFDSLETDKLLWIVTEEAKNLLSYLDQMKHSNSEQLELIISWGLFQIASTIQFLTQDGKLIHHNINATSVFVTPGGEWKLFGLEYTTPQGDRPTTKLHGLDKYSPPELKSGRSPPSNQPWCTDMWGLACLIWESFNGVLPSQTALKTPKNIPKSLHSVYASLISGNPTRRPSPEEFLRETRKPGGFLKNKFLDTLLFLDEYQLKDARDKSAFFNGLREHLDVFPEDIAKNKILPKLIQAYQYGEAGSSVLSPLFRLGKLLSEEEYQVQIIPCLVKLFGSTDRATRVKLLDRIEELVTHLTPPVVNDKIFANLVTGFLDTNPAVREATVKAMVYLSPKLNYNNLNVELMKHLARLQGKDDQSGIRTNTTICLGKIGSYLHPSIRQKVLLSAFTRATKDPFPPARVAGVLSLSASQQFYPLVEIANRVLPCLCALTIDPEKQVRDQAFKAITGFMETLTKASENPELIPELESQVQAGSGGMLSSEKVPQWASWAVSALSGRFYKASPAPKAEADKKELTPPITDDKPAKMEESPRQVASETWQDAEEGWGELQGEESGWGEDDEPLEGWDDFDPPLPVKTATSGVQEKKPSLFDAKKKEAKEDDFLADLLGEVPSSQKTKKSAGWEVDWNDSNPSKEAWDDDKFGTDEDWGWGEKAKSGEKGSQSEKKERRQREVEAKRRTKGGAMKLGVRKIT